MTNIKEVIHLYLGCEVYTEFEDGSKGIVQLNEYYLKAIRQEWITDRPVPTICTLRLRRLDSMTEAEAIHIAETILFHSYIGFDGRIEKSKDRITVYDKGNYEGDKVALLFCGEFCLTIEGKVDSVPFEYSYEIIPYLLKQGFDLFGLIDSGQAIDKNFKP